jgi:hypothetical protein
MEDSFDHRTPTSLLVVATLVGGLLLAGCGGSSQSPTTSTPTVTTAGAPGSPPAAAPATAPADVNASALAFARCMRANGVSNFRDPNPGGGFLFNASGIDRSSPAFRAAQAKCQKLLPVGGPPVPGTKTHPSAQTLAKLVKIAQCMRGHGVPQFPDPRTSVPADPFPSGQGVITDYDGAILLFPSTLDIQSPAYTRAAAACGTLAGKLGRGPHS